jgi:hypothetical protein
MGIFDQYTNTNLLKDIRLKGSLPESTNENDHTYDENILSVASQELHSRILPLFISAQEEFYVASETITLVAGQDSYDLNARNFSLLSRDIRWVKNNVVRSLPFMGREDIYSLDSGELQGFYFDHEKLKVFKAPQPGEGSLVVDYYWRPNVLIPTDDCAQISSIDTGTNTVTVSSIPSTWATNDIFDLVAFKTPYITRATSLTGTVSGSNITFSSLPSGLTENDWIAPEGKTPIPQIPFSARLLLITAATANILHAVSDKGNGDRIKKEYEDLEQRYLNMIEPRTTGETKKVTNDNFFTTGGYF